MSKGKLIVIDGLDKAGKATQVGMLRDYLNEHLTCEVWSKSFPDYDTDTGKLIADYLKHRQKFSQKSINIIYTANRLTHKQPIENLMKQGSILILDRYYFSNMAYGTDENNSMEEIEAMDLDMPKPDLVIFIDITAEESLRRSGKTADGNEKDLNLQRRARLNYHKLFLKYGDRFSVNGEEDKQEIHEQIVAKVEKLLNDSKS